MAAASMRNPDGATTVQGLVQPFLDLVRGYEPITLPRETLFGAITHFLSHLNVREIPGLIQAVATSPSLWARPDVEGLLDAIRLAPAAKLASLQDRYADSYFPSIRRRRAAGIWLDAVCHGISSESPGALRRASLLVALFEGVDGTDFAWGTAREKLEDEIVLALAEAASEGEGFVEVLGRSMDHVNDGLLFLLDWQKLLPELQERFFAAVAKLDSDANQVARLLGSALQLLNRGGPSIRRHALTATTDAIRQMRSIASRAEVANSDTLQPPDAKNVETRRQSSEAFVTLSAHLIDILIADLAQVSSRSSLLALDLLTILVDSADLVDNTTYDYAKVYAGILDVLSAQATTLEVTSFFGELLSETFVSSGHANLILGVAEQLMDKLSARTLRLLLPVAEEYVRRPDCASAFEAAHSFLKAVLDSTSKTFETSDAQIDFFDDVLRFYAPLLLKQMLRGDIFGEQFRDGFVSLAASASRRSPSHVPYLLDLLDVSSVEFHRQTLDLTRIAVTPNVSLDHLQLHLDRLASIIMSISGSEQAELARAAFRMIGEGLGDEARKVGMQWWLNWSPRFGFRAVDLRAKL